MVLKLLEFEYCFVKKHHVFCGLSDLMASFRKLLLVLILLVTQAAQSRADIVEQYLTISRGKFSFAGESIEALTVNGSIPAPTLRFEEGDTVRIHVKNELDEDSSIHWHGLLLPNNMDGVPNMTYPPILPGKTFTYEFTLKQAGTYWYHSHTRLQEQRGLYGAFVIEPKDKSEIDLHPDQVLVLSDWTNESPDTVLHTLKRGSEYYSLKKQSAQSILGAASVGMLRDYYTRELSRMPPMDISDVYYDAFLINGQRTSTASVVGDGPVRLRIINGSASTIFYTQFAGGPMEVVSADGQAVEPFKIDRLLIGVAETYDVLVKPRSGESFEFRATPHDNSGKASLWLGLGDQRACPDLPWPNLYESMHGFSWGSLFAVTPWGAMGMSDSSMSMEHDMHGPHHAMMQKQSSPEGGSTWLGLLSNDVSAHKSLSRRSSKSRPEPPYEKLIAKHRTKFSPEKIVRELRLTLDGDMERYVWMINNKTMSESDSILIRKDEVVRFVMTNRTMMYHPMHLHGHFFRVLNKHGDYSPLKHTVVVAPMSTTVIEFEADVEGDWFFHCHLLYHMMSGMAQMVHYDGFTPASNIDQSKLRHDDFYYMGNVSGLSNMTDGEITLSSARNIFALEWELGWQSVEDYEWEFTPTYDYYINRLWSVFIGGDFDGDNDGFDVEHGVVGFRYLLPLNIESRHWLDSELNYQINLKKTLELTPELHLYGDLEYDTDADWEIRSGFTYQVSRDFALKGLWHSYYKWGAGIQFSF